MIHKIVFYSPDELFISHKKQGKGCLKIPFARPYDVGAFSTAYTPFLQMGVLDVQKPNRGTQ
jgi:hypothetical protein